MNSLTLESRNSLHPGSEIVFAWRFPAPSLALPGVILSGSRRRTLTSFMPNPMTPPNPSMSDPNTPEPNTSNSGTRESAPANEPVESFKDVFSEYEKSHSRKREPGAQGREGTVITVTAESVVLDIGFKTEGVLPLTAFPADKPPKPGDKVQVTVKGRD